MRGTSGFTLIELAIVVAVIGLMLSVTLPVSYRMYTNYQNSLEAEKVLTAISAIRRESFMYGEERLIEVKKGTLFVEGKAHPGFAGISMTADKPIMFYRNGTSSGGTLKLTIKDDPFRIHISEPLADLRMLRGHEDEAGEGRQ
jgi:prepilin-type N-terminal cleavage/methylation domain-containing protein